MGKPSEERRGGGGARKYAKFRGGSVQIKIPCCAE